MYLRARDYRHRAFELEYPGIIGRLTSGSGAIHEVMITLESLPADMGGSRERAAMHYQRALELTGGNSAGPHVSYALGVLLPQQKRDEFASIVNKALQVDVDREPRFRLANILAQRYARYLLERLDDLFFADKEV